MNWKDHTTEQLAQNAENVGNRLVDEVIRAFLREEPSKDIESFSAKLSIHKSNKQWIETANLALQLKRTEEIADKFTVQMDRLIQHTHKLNEQAIEQIKVTTELTAQNVILVKESRALTKYTKRLYWLTWAVVGLSVVLAVLGILDYLDKHSSEPTIKNSSVNKF